MESQGKLLGSENETGSPDFYTPRTRSSNGSDPMDDCSSCTSHSSSEHYYPAQMNPNYSTLAEDSPSKARERQRQRHKSAGNLVSSNSGSMPNLAARNGTGHHRVYLHSQSQPSSQYRIKEYPLYIEGSSTPVVVRSLENDQEGHYSVKAQFKTSNSYTAGGMFKENWHGDEVDSVRLTPSRSQIIRTPSLGREGQEKGSGRTAVSDELRLWYQRSTASHKEHSRLSHTSSTSSDSSSQYSTSSQSTFVAHSRVTRMPQMCKATSGESQARAERGRRDGSFVQARSVPGVTAQLESSARTQRLIWPSHTAHQAWKCDTGGQALSKPLIKWEFFSWKSSLFNYGLQSQRDQSLWLLPGLSSECSWVLGDGTRG